MVVLTCIQGEISSQVNLLFWNKGFYSKMVTLVWKASDCCRIKSLFCYNRLSFSSCSTMAVCVQRPGEVPEQNLILGIPKNKVASAMSWGFFKKEPLPNLFFCLFIPREPIKLSHLTSYSLLRTCVSSCMKLWAPFRGMILFYTYYFCRSANEENVIQEGTKPITSAKE